MRTLKRYWLRWHPLLSISLLLWLVPNTPRRPLAPTQPRTGTIAFVRPGGQAADEIWLIEPDGSNPRRIWDVGQADPNGIAEISDLDWRPDATELAFASDHEFACSLFDSDLYGIRPDGNGHRRITNGPLCAELASYPQGAVSVTVRNFTTLSPLFVYVQGAPEVQSVLIPQGGSATVTFNHVADFGDEVLQQAVAIWGLDRWLAPIALVDVRPGQTTHAGTIDVGGTGFQNFGAYVPSWYSDGARLGYILTSAGSMYGLPATPAAGDHGQPLLNLAQGEIPSSDVLDWGPAPTHTNELLYASYLNSGIYRVTEGSDTPGTKLFDTGIEQVIDVQWLPDGSGFLYTQTGEFRSQANVFHYDFTSQAVAPLTTLTNEFAIDLSPSPDSQWVVFERSATLDLTSGDLWIMRRDGTELRLLVENGLRPSWSARAPQLPSTPTPATPTPTATPDGSPTATTTPKPSGTPPGKQRYLPMVQR
jgi:hypothetical protein